MQAWDESFDIVRKRILPKLFPIFKIESSEICGWIFCEI